MNLFSSCAHPYSVTTPNGSILVPCGKCPGCLTSKANYHTSLLDIESQCCKYTEMITLTYSNDYLPLLDFSDIRHQNTSSDVLVRLHLGSRKVTRFLHGKYIECVDKSFIEPRYFPIYGFKHDVTNLLIQYYDRIKQYFKRFPERSSEICKYGLVPILYYEDIHKFTDRLQKYFRTTFNEKVRYYVVGEYGTNSLRPHWHLLLFHNSDSIRSAFERVIKLPNYTEINKRECASIFFGYKIWKYGDIVTTTTDGKCSNYVASYLNQHANLPNILEVAPQKAFKSLFFGEKRSVETVSSLFKSENFQRLTSTSLQTRQGAIKDISVPSSSFYRFSIRFTCSDRKDYRANYALLSQVHRFLQTTDLNIYDDDCIYSILQHIRKYNTTLSARYSLLCSYVSKVAYPHYYEKRTLNPLKSLFYASYKLYKMSGALSVHPYTYMRIEQNLRLYLDYQRLTELYKLMEDKPVLPYQYYSSFTNCTLDYEKYKTTPEYQRILLDAMMSFDSNIKHKRASQTYKIDLYE